MYLLLDHIPRHGNFRQALKKQCLCKFTTVQETGTEHQHSPVASFETLFRIWTNSDK